MNLILESITLNNFKSYKGTHKITKIDKSFTAIVGPNGSGKSNIIDSILFVLGFRAKKMRHSQLTDLIYNDGTQQKSCHVELGFNKFSIKREVCNNKSSSYYHNNKEIGISELITLMQNEGIDMEHNRFLILQGEIEGIAMLKPKEGLLEFLEDIIGSSKFKTEIGLTFENLKKEEDENINTTNTLKFIKTEYDHIFELKEQNEKIFIKNYQHKQNESEFKLLNIEKMDRLSIEYKEEKHEIENQILKIKSFNIETKYLLNTLEKELKSISILLKGKENEYLIAKKQYKTVERNNSNKKELKNKLEKQLSLLKNEIRNKKEKFEMKVAENKILKKELEENNEECKKLNKKLIDLKKKAQEEEIRISKVAKQDINTIKKCEENLIKLINKRNKQNECNSQNIAELKISKEKIENLKSEIEILKSKIVKTFEIKNLNQEQIRKELNEVEADIQKSQIELDSRKRRYNEVCQKHEKEKKENETMNNLKHLEGVHGRLKDIGDVDHKYSLALKASCNRLNNIVVDSTTTAEKCIEIIRKKKLPRSTFIILDKIKEIPNLPQEKAPYLFELISCDKIYKKCFYFALTTTLVVETLENAKLLAFGQNRKRVTTLDGKLIEKSGVMTGGKFNEKVKKYEEIENALLKMEIVRKQKIDDLNKIKDFENNRNIEKILNDKNKELESLKKQVGKFKSLIKDVPFDLEIAELKQQIKKQKDNLENLCDSSLRSNLTLLNEKIELLESRSRDILINLNEISDSPDELEKDLINVNTKIENISIEDCTDLKREMEEKEECYKEILDDFTKLQNEVTQLKKKIGHEYHAEIELKDKQEEIENKIIKISKKLEFEKQNVSTLKTDLKQMYEFYKKNLKSCDLPSISEISDKDIKNLQDEDINDYLKQLDKKLKLVKENQEVEFVIFEEFRKIKNEYDSVLAKSESQQNSIEKKKKEIDSLKKQRLKVFTQGLQKVNIYLKEIYKRLTYGGNAELEMIDYLDPFSDGIRLAIMPPKKCWKDVSNLSGGEKTLSSLSLIFALHKFKPSPFYVMDEIDAALDYRNVSIISEYIKEMAKTSQFIVISLRNDMFEISNSILGVYKTNNVSKFLMVNVDEFKKSMKA